MMTAASNAECAISADLECLFVIADVWKYRFNGKQRLNALEGFSASIRRRGIVTVVGPSGSGKSTLLLLLNRLEDPDRGRVLYGGKDLLEWNPLELRRRVGMVFQQPLMLPGTVQENVLYGPALLGQEREADPAGLLRMVGLDPELADRDGRDLSGGQQQRVALARVLANHPETLLLDEPTSALDENAARVVEQIVLNMNRKAGLTCVWVTHDLQQALRLDGETWVLDDGRLVEAGPTAQVLERPQHPAAKDYLRSRLERGEGR